MIRITDIALIGVVIAGAVYTYNIKHDAELSAKRIGNLRAQITAQNRKIALLEADWALETGPARLEKIAQRYAAQLELKTMESSQIVDTSELPAFRVERNDEDDPVHVEADSDILTGGIGALIDREDSN